MCYGAFKWTKIKTFQSLSSHVMIVFSRNMTIKWLAHQVHIVKPQVRISTRISVALYGGFVALVTVFRQRPWQGL
jgi:hypothetical protein